MFNAVHLVNCYTIQSSRKIKTEALMVFVVWLSVSGGMLVTISTPRGGRAGSRKGSGREKTHRDSVR